MRSEVDRLLDQIDNRFLKIVHVMLKTYMDEKEGVVGAYPNGNPITQEELEANIERSEEQYKKGQYISVEELDQKSKKWVQGTK